MVDSVLCWCLRWPLQLLTWLLVWLLIWSVGLAAMSWGLSHVNVGTHYGMGYKNNVAKGGTCHVDIVIYCNMGNRVEYFEMAH